MRRNPPHAPFHTPWQILLHWLWLAGLMAFGLMVAWDKGLLWFMIATDSSYICAVILILFIAGSLHCGWRSYVLAQEANAVLYLPKPAPAHTAIGQYTQAVQVHHADPALQADWLAEQLRGPQQSGWFVDAGLIKLGLLGTVVGFVIMLGSLSKLESLETTQIQNLMNQMTSGMGVALNTTVFGLVGSLLLGLQYMYLDRCADQLLAAVIRPRPQGGIA